MYYLAADYFGVEIQNSVPSASDAGDKPKDEGTLGMSTER
jgi:hypothetical protein